MWCDQAQWVRTRLSGFLAISFVFDCSEQHWNCHISGTVSCHGFWAALRRQYAIKIDFNFSISDSLWLHHKWFCMLNLLLTNTVLMILGHNLYIITNLQLWKKRDTDSHMYRRGILQWYLHKSMQGVRSKVTYREGPCPWLVFPNRQGGGLRPTGIKRKTTTREDKITSYGI